MELCPCTLELHPITLYHKPHIRRHWRNGATSLEDGTLRHHDPFSRLPAVGSSLMLRSFESPISPDEIIEVQDYIQDRALVELGDPPRPIAIARAIPRPSYPCSRIVAFGDAIGDDWARRGFSFGVGRPNQECITRAHQDALEWFRQQLACPLGSQGNVSSKHQLP